MRVRTWEAWARGEHLTRLKEATTFLPVLIPEGKVAREARKFWT